MSRRRKHSVSSPLQNWRRDLALRVAEQRLPNRIITVSIPLPLSVAKKARREIYPYPLPLQKRLKGRTIRRPLVVRSDAPLVMTKVRIRAPARLALALGSYVSLSRGRLNIHSKNQLARAVHRLEKNRRRYSEFKSNRRKARHGQLDSPGATAFGSVAAAYKLGHSIERIADAALGARAILKRRR